MFRIATSVTGSFTTRYGARWTAFLMSAVPTTATTVSTNGWIRTTSSFSTSTPISSSSNSSNRSGSSSTNDPNQSPVFEKIACIGAGKMAQAIIQPMIHGGLQPKDRFMIFDVSTNMMQDVADKYGVRCAESIAEAVQDSDLVMFAVKPQNMNSAFFAEFHHGLVRPDAICLSVIAGKAISEFGKAGFTKVVRSMPNTPATIGQGMTVWSCTSSLTATEREKIKQVLNSFGQSMYVDDEKFIDVATSISGSGPAYIFMLMESMIDAGVHMGFPRDKATTLVYHTMLGSTLYAMESGEHPAILRNKVTSPSGTTASALYELENGRFRTVIKDAMWACYRRSLEMGHQDSNVGPGRHHIPEPRVVITTNTAPESDNGNRQ